MPNYAALAAAHKSAVFPTFKTAYISAIRTAINDSDETTDRTADEASN